LSSTPTADSHPLSLHDALPISQAFRELVQIGITLTSERDLSVLLERILTEARRFTRAEAGTLFLRDGEQLRFAVVQNDRLSGKLDRKSTRLNSSHVSISYAVFC